MNKEETIVATVVITAVATYIVMKVYNFIHNRIYFYNGKLYKQVNSDQMNYCIEIIGIVFYNLYHNNSPKTREVCYSTFKWLKDVLDNGMPILCNLYWLEKNTPQIFKMEYENKKQQVIEDQEETKAAKETYFYQSWSDKFFARYKSGNGKNIDREITEEEFLSKANRQDIEKYYEEKEAY